MEKSLNIILNTKNRNIKLVLKALIVGILSAFIAVPYRFTLGYAEKASFFIYDFQNQNKWFIPIWFLILACLGYIVGKMMEKEPYASGSGIPHVKGVMGGYVDNRPLSIIISKFIGGVLSIVAGLSLGREGPSVQLGAATGDFVSSKLKTTRLERRLLISSGASAGLSAAFNAPLSGVMFSLEEIYKYFSPLVLLSTMISALSADFISKNFFGLKPVFDFGKITPMPLQNYWVLIVLGLVLGLAGAFYNWATLKTQDLYGKIKCSLPIRMMIPFIFAGILGLSFPVVLGGGHKVIEELTLNSTLTLLIVVLIGKFLFSIMSFGSGAPGGIFFPLLIIGGTIGAVFGHISINYLGIDSSFFNNFIVLAMAGYFTAIVRAPITGVILITEMTGSFNNLLSLTIVSIIAYIIADLLKSDPIYESLLERLIAKNKNEKHNVESSKKIIISNVVHFGSKIENKTVKDSKLGENILLVSIKRGEQDIIPRGSTVIKAGDQLYAVTDLKNEWKTREFLEEITTSSLSTAKK